MSSIRARFKVKSITREKISSCIAGPGGVPQYAWVEMRTIKLFPVLTRDGEPVEQAKFLKSHPFCNIELGCVDPAEFDKYELGSEHDVEIAVAISH